MFKSGKLKSKSIFKFFEDLSNGKLDKFSARWYDKFLCLFFKNSMRIDFFTNLIEPNLIEHFADCNKSCLSLVIKWSDLLWYPHQSWTMLKFREHLHGKE
jgi:hypothetical protein